MDKLSNDELLLIIMEMKKEYNKGYELLKKHHEKEYELLQNKYLSLQSLTYNECNELSMLNNNICSVCKARTYIAKDQSLIYENMVFCKGCNKVCCFDCLDDDDQFITEYFDNPIPNKFWCKDCHEIMNSNELFSKSSQKE